MYSKNFSLAHLKKEKRILVVVVLSRGELFMRYDDASVSLVPQLSPTDY